MSDDSADKRAVGAHPESFSGRAHSRWTSWTQADPDPMCFRSCTVDTQHRRTVAHAAAKLSELQIRSSALAASVDGCSGMLHRCDVRDGEGWRGKDRTDEARGRQEKQGNRG